MDRSTSMEMKQEPMQEHEESRGGRFDWKIDNFLGKEGRMESPTFKFGRNEVYLYTPGINKEPGPYCGMYIINMHNSVVHGVRSFTSKTYHTLSLIDCHGQTYLTLRGTTVKEPCVSLCFSKSYLLDHSETLLPGDSLSVRLSWFPGFEVMRLCTQVVSVSPDKLLMNLSRHFSSLYESKTNTDCVLRANDGQFSVHRVVLSARSTVFAAMFRHDTSENRTGIVNIPDVDAAVLSDVIQYVYAGKINGITSDTAAPMYVVADKYAMEDLKDACRRFLMHNLTVKNVCEVAILAQTYEEIELEKEIVLFIDNNYEELEKNDEWTLFTNTKPLLANKLLRSAYSNCRKVKSDKKKHKKSHP